MIPFPHKDLIAFISDASMDFTPTDFDQPLTQAQHDYLKQKTGYDIPQVFWRKQVHGDDVIIVNGNASSCHEFGDADAYITRQKHVPIAIRTADCVPVFIYDAGKQIIGVAHAGWKGTHKEIAKKTVMLMQEKYDSRWHDIWVYLGPSIRACCYTVGHEFKTYFPQDVIDHPDGTITVDLIKANVRQLRQLGLSPSQIMDADTCTCCSGQYFSFRKDREKAGRMISLMMLL